MNIVQLKYFCAVCVYGSVSAAAENLFVSQPSLSSAIKQLEEQFGVQLFKRQRKGMTLTAEGKKLKPLAENLILQAEQIERCMADLGNNKKVLRLGVPPMIGSVILSHIYGEFIRKNPDIILDVCEAGREDLSVMLDESRLDAVFLPHNTPFSEDYKTLKIAEFEIVYCTAKKQEGNLTGGVTPSDLKDTPLVLFKDNFFQAQEIKKWFSNAGVVPNVLLQTDQLSTLNNMVVSGTASGFMFRQLINDNLGLKLLPMDKPIYASVSLVWLAKSGVFNSMKRFIDFFKDYKIQ